LVVLEIQKSGEIKNTDNAQIKYKSEKKQHKKQQNKTSLVQSPFTTLGQKTRWAYSKNLLGNPRWDYICMHGQLV